MRKLFLLVLLYPLLAFSNPTTAIYNLSNDTLVVGSLDSNELSIASITKLMTAYTVLKEEQDLDEILTVVSPRTPNTVLSKGMKLSRRELLDLSLVSSDNLAAITLAENFPGGLDVFVERMNIYARSLELQNTNFVEPTGLNAKNSSTISDVIKLTKAVSEFELVKNAAQLTEVSFIPTIEEKKKKDKKQPKRRFSNNPTSHYFGKEGVVTIKTGFTRAAGFCITMLVKANNQVYNVVVLGAKTKQERQKLVDKMLKTIYYA